MTVQLSELYYAGAILSWLVIAIFFFAYLKSEIKKRPSYEKVEKMIDEKAVTKADGMVLDNEVCHLREDVAEIKETTTTTNKLVADMQHTFTKFITAAKKA